MGKTQVRLHSEVLCSVGICAFGSVLHVLCLHLNLGCVSEDMQHCGKGCAFRQHSSCVLCFEGIQREMGAGEPGNKVKAALPGGGGGGGGEGDSWI